MKEAPLTEAGLSDPNGRFFRLSPSPLQSIESLRNFLNQAVQNCCSSCELAHCVLSFHRLPIACVALPDAHHHGIVSALANVEGVIASQVAAVLEARRARRLLRDFASSTL